MSRKHGCRLGTILSELNHLRSRLPRVIERAGNVIVAAQAVEDGPDIRPVLERNAKLPCPFVRRSSQGIAISRGCAESVAKAYLKHKLSCRPRIWRKAIEQSKGCAIVAGCLGIGGAFKRTAASLLPVADCELDQASLRIVM